MKELTLSRKAMPLKVDGTFKPIGRFELMEGYDAWRTHADSILSGQLKAKGLDLDYALKGDKVKDAEESGSGLGWRGWTRILTFTATAAFGTLAVVKHLDAGDAKDKIKQLNRDYRDKNLAPNTAEYRTWYNKYVEQADKVKDSESSRNIFGIGAGVFAVAATLTFVF
jgi:hypothetical protein